MYMGAKLVSAPSACVLIVFFPAPPQDQVWAQKCLRFMTFIASEG